MNYRPEPDKCAIYGCHRLQWIEPLYPMRLGNGPRRADDQPYGYTIHSCCYRHTVGPRK